jgi:uncharacterized membrane protein YeiB
MESQANPKTQRISGYILIILACLGFILSLIANLLEGKIITSGFIFTTIGSVCFFILGMIMIRNSKKQMVIGEKK